MNPIEFATLVEEVKAFAAEAEFKEQSGKYLAYRKQLMAIYKDESVDESIRIDAYRLQYDLKWMFNSEYGKGLIDRLKQYPESTLYGNRECLTTRCRKAVVKLAERFEFKPQPLALGVKHYYAVTNGS